MCSGRRFSDEGFRSQGIVVTYGRWQLPPAILSITLSSRGFGAAKWASPPISTRWDVGIGKTFDTTPGPDY
jgi:hypothetical protein